MKKNHGCLITGARLLILVFGLFALVNGAEDILKFRELDTSSRPVPAKVVERDILKGRASESIRYRLVVEYAVKGATYRATRPVLESIYNEAKPGDQVELLVSSADPENARLVHGESAGLFWYAIQAFIGAFMVFLAIILGKLVKVTQKSDRGTN